MTALKISWLSIAAVRSVTIFARSFPDTILEFVLGIALWSMTNSRHGLQSMPTRTNAKRSPFQLLLLSMTTTSSKQLSLAISRSTPSTHSWENWKKKPMRRFTSSISSNAWLPTQVVAVWFLGGQEKHIKANAYWPSRVLTLWYERAPATLTSSTWLKIWASNASGLP